MKSMLLSFIGPASNLKLAGINLVFEQAGTRGMHMLFATGGYHVADGDAIKQCLGVKGASGSLP
eukprot:9835671-Karenia_brevis.AAC.1